jgi:hypothetical protein
MNDYEQLSQDVQEAINATETAYYNAVDPEDEAKLDEAMDILKGVKANAERKA